MIKPGIYNEYLDALLAGKKSVCLDILNSVITPRTDPKVIYTGFFQASMYEVGRRWENHTLTVVDEHLASRITEDLIASVWGKFRPKSFNGKTIVIACCPDEYHQIGAKIVADFFDLSGWITYFLGANTPLADLLVFISQVKPSAVGLSLSMSSNMDRLIESVDKIMLRNPLIKVLVGGQGVSYVLPDYKKYLDDALFLPSLEHIETFINRSQ